MELLGAMEDTANISDVLKFDPLDVAERITGTSTHDANSPAMALGFLLAMKHGARKEEMLAEIGDTRFSNTLSDYVAIVEKAGFEQVLALPFAGNEDVQETMFVFARHDGLLLRFDTYQSDRVNGGAVYYNWRPDSIKTMHRYTSSGGMVSDTVWAGDHDCREAIVHKMKQLQENGACVSPWVKRPFLWLLHYMDAKVEGYDYEAINASRVAMLPEWVREFIGPQRRTRGAES